MRFAAMILAVLLMITARATAEDYDIDSDAWRGAQNLLLLASALGMEVSVPDEIAWDDLEQNDILLILHYENELEAAHVTTFLRNGGRVIIADDSGSAGPALSRLGFERTTGTSEAQEFYQGLKHAPIARPRSNHPIANGVAKLYTNEPAVFKNESSNIFGFSSGEGIVAAGKRGRGEFVVVTDPSIFINRMLEFEENREFTSNVLRYISGERPGQSTLVILTGEAKLFGAPTKIYRSGNWSEKLNAIVDGANDYLFTEAGAKAIAIVLAVLAPFFFLLFVPLSHRLPASASWTKFANIRGNNAPQAINAIEENPKQANAVIPASLMKDELVQTLCSLLQREIPPTDAEAIRYLSENFGPEAAKQYKVCASAFQSVPNLAQAQSPWYQGHISTAAMMTLSDKLQRFHQLVRTQQ